MSSVSHLRFVVERRGRAAGAWGMARDGHVFSRSVIPDFRMVHALSGCGVWRLVIGANSPFALVFGLETLC